jgi:hypothetical protein
MTGTFVVTTSAQATDTTAQISASLNGITKSATLWVLSAAGNATYDATLKVPRCTAASSYCDTGPDLVRGRGAILGGVETNAPNTLAGTCADGSAGMFHYDESLDRLKISTVDGTALAAGKQVNVEATVWIYSGNDHLDIFFAPDANAPVWALVSTVTVTASQSQRILNASFALPEATLPAIRAQWRYGGSGVPCAAGIYNDRDDLVFTYGTGADTTPPTVAITSPASGTAVRTVVPVSIDAEDDVGIASVVLAVDGSKAAETVGTAPYQIPLVTPNYPDGPHDLTAIAMDGAGNVTVSSAVSLVFDNTSPSVVIVTPAPGSIVSGIVAVGANATDATSGVAVVEFLVDGVILGSDATAPYSLDWNTTSVTTGDHVLTARATDRAGNQMGSLPVTVTVTIENQPPVVDAGPDLVVNLADEAALNGSVTDDGLPAPPALVIAWTVTSGPGIVTFTDPAAATTTARFTAAGTYVLRLSASDGALSAYDEVQVVVNAANTPPVVDAGPDLSVGLSSAAALEGSVTDDGLPAPPALTIVWTMTSGPGTVTFADPSAASTTATFSAAGVYVLRLSASDGALSAFDETQVTVSVENQAPVVNAGPDRAVTFPAVATLDGTATDDGLPAPAILAILWTKVSGPGTVTFANPNEAATTASFDAVGTYVLRLTADDGELSSSDDVQVTVSAQNQAPVVDAGPDLTVTLPATLPINGTVTDDGLPAPPNLSITWTKTSGPGTVTFTPANAAATTASFSAAGTYVLRLSASDGALSSSDEVQVTVSPANTAPVVNAGPDRTVTLPSTLTINGTVTDDGLPAPPTLTITWSQTSGPGTVTFSPVGAATTTASFSAAGTYVLRLTASDGELSSSDEVQVVVSGTGSSPCAGLCSNPVNFTIGSNYQSGNLGTGAGCYQTTSVIHGGNCGNFTSPRTLSVNGTQETCTYTNWSSIPATRNGGYCIQITAGNYSWAYFSLW